MTSRDIHLPAQGFSLKRGLAAVGNFFAAIGTALVEFGAQSARFKELERLQSKSDAELAAMGLRREDIAQHVFRHLHYI